MRTGRSIHPWPVAAAAENLPFRDGSFDPVICGVTPPYTDLAAAVREMHRVLAAGGRARLTLHNWRMANWRGRI